MKKLFLGLILSFYAFLYAGTARGQTLNLVQVSGVPDTITGNTTVSMNIILSNSGGFVFNADIAVLIHVVGDSSAPDTMYYNAQYQLSGNTAGDTISITDTFETADYEAGDNIVVVWPASSQMPAAVNGDSLTFNVFYKTLGIEQHPWLQTISLFPVPAGENLYLEVSHPEKVKQVRICDMLGKELMRFEDPVTGINTEPLSSGIYLVQVLNKDHSSVVKKFLRE